MAKGEQEAWTGGIALPGSPTEPYQHSREDVVASGLRPGFYALWAAVGCWLIGVFLALISRNVWLFYYCFAGSFLVAAGVLFILIYTENAFYMAERKLRIDINRDGFVGRPGAEEDIRFVPIRNAATYRMTARERFVDFIEGCDVDTTTRRWHPTIGRKAYEAWRDWLIAGGFARWKNPEHRQAWDLTKAAAAIIAELPGEDEGLPLSPIEENSV